MPDRALVTASGTLKARKSVSASGRSIRNGSTISRVIARAGAPASAGASAIASRSSEAIVAALSGRWAGTFSSARRTTRSKAATAAPPASGGGGSFTMAWNTWIAVRPSNGGRPASIS